MKWCLKIYEKLIMKTIEGLIDIDIENGRVGLVDKNIISDELMKKYILTPAMELERTVLRDYDNNGIKVDRFISTSDLRMMISDLKKVYKKKAVSTINANISIVALIISVSSCLVSIIKK